MKSNNQNQKSRSQKEIKGSENLKYNGLSTRVFNVDGTEYLGGEINYIGVGAYNAAFTGSLIGVFLDGPEVLVWNIAQFAVFFNNPDPSIYFDWSTAGQMHNLTTIHNNQHWARYGSLYAY